MKILTFDCHESLICAWAKLGHEIHLLPYIKEWAWNIRKRPIPENVKLLPDGFQPNYKDYNIGIAFNEHTQLPLVRKWGIPYLISFASLANIRDPEALRGERMVFCAFSQRDHYQEKYGPHIEGDVIYYGIDIDEYYKNEGTNGKILSTINYFGQSGNKGPRGYDWAKSITRGLPYDNWGWSLARDAIQFPHPNSFDELRALYRDYAIYLDPCVSSPMSMSNLEAMASGMPLVTREHDDWPLIIQDGINGLISDNDEYIRNHIMGLLVASEERIRIGNNARETIREKFNIQSWKENWNRVFQEMGVL